MSSKKSCAVRSSSQREFELFNQLMLIPSPMDFFALKRPALAPIFGLKPVKKDSKKLALVEKNQAFYRSQTIILILGSPKVEKCKKKKQLDEGFRVFLRLVPCPKRKSLRTKF